MYAIRSYYVGARTGHPPASAQKFFETHQTAADNRAIDEAAWDALVAPWKSNRPQSMYKPVGCLECP